MGISAGAAAAIGAATSLIGTGVSVYGASQQAAAQQKAQQYQAQVAQNNATLAQQNAKAVQDQAAVKGEQDLRIATMRGAAQRAQLGASGVALDGGSALDVQGATAGAGMISAQGDIYSGDLSARSYLAQASNFDATSTLDTLAGQNAETAGLYSAGSSFLGGASQVADKWAAWKNTTRPPSTTPAAAPTSSLGVPGDFNGVGVGYGTGGLY